MLQYIRYTAADAGVRFCGGSRAHGSAYGRGWACAFGDDQPNWGNECYDHLRKEYIAGAMEPEDMEMLRAATNDPEIERMVGGWSSRQNR